MISSDYKMTFGYKRTDAPYGTAKFPYHRGDDWFMPEGTPIVVNGVQIGISGQTGFVTGPHCHIGRFVGGSDTNPNSQGWQLDNPHVTDIGYDDVNGNYVGLLDAQGVRWVYLHMKEKSGSVKVGDYLNQLTKYEVENMAELLNDGDVTNMYYNLLGHDADEQTKKNWAGHDFKELFYAIVESDEYKLKPKSSNASPTVLAPGNYQVK
jgi:hypothetical protein